MSDSENLIIERSRSAREELLLRVTYRDSWLKLQLLAQAIIWSLAKGIKLGGAESTVPFPQALALASPIALVFAALYYVEDGLIHRLSKYMKRLDEGSWDSSQELNSYATGLTLKLRLIALITAFVVLPFYLILLQLPLECWKVTIHAFFLVLTLALVIVGYLERERTGGASA